ARRRPRVHRSRATPRRVLTPRRRRPPARAARTRRQRKQGGLSLWTPRKWQDPPGRRDGTQRRLGHVYPACDRRRRPPDRHVRSDQPRLARGDREPQTGIVKTATSDRRWVRIRPPVITVGGELTLEMLELTFSPLA